MNHATLAVKNVRVQVKTTAQNVTIPSENLQKILKKLVLVHVLGRMDSTIVMNKKKAANV